MPSALFTRDVADGVHQLTHAYVNAYLIEDRTGVTIVDLGLPLMWPRMIMALRELGRGPADVRGVVLTHAHFDHIGPARRLQEMTDVPIWLNEADGYIARHPYRYRHERPRLLYPLRYPGGRRILGAMGLAGALTVRGFGDTRALRDGDELDLPGGPRVIATPGHTAGHVALHLPERDALLVGDALVTLDPYTGAEGPQIVAGAATADSAQNLRSLDALVATDARIVLPGHGLAWKNGIAEAVELAKRRGAS